MRKKNPNPKRHKIAAQTICEEPEHTGDQKVWPKASMKGWCVRGIVVLQLGLCLVAVHLICWHSTGCQQLFAQERENFFATKVQRICHQGQIERQTATVSKQIAKKKRKKPNADINVCCWQRYLTAFARKGVSWKFWENIEKSQKPSQVNGVLRKLDSQVEIDSIARGLITPIVSANEKRQRRDNLCSVAAQLRKNRQIYLANKRLLAGQRNRGRSLEKEEIKASLRHIQ